MSRTPRTTESFPLFEFLAIWRTAQEKGTVSIHRPTKALCQTLRAEMNKCKHALVREDHQYKDVAIRLATTLEPSPTPTEPDRHTLTITPAGSYMKGILEEAGIEPFDPLSFDPLEPQETSERKRSHTDDALLQFTSGGKK